MAEISSIENHMKKLERACNSLNNTDYNQTGGARWDAGNWFPLSVSFPFADLHLNDETLCISVKALIIRKSFVFNKSEIINIHKTFIFPNPFSPVVQIEHSKSDYPKFIVFWPSNLNGLRKELIRRGYRWV